MLIDDKQYDIDSPPTFPIEIIHEYRAMAITLNQSKNGLILLINGVDFNGLIDVNNKNTFSEEVRCREDFTKFFKRYHLS